MAKPPTSKPKEPKPSNRYLKYSNLGLQLVVNIAVAGFAGYWLDGELELAFPIFLLLFIFGAFVGSMYRLYKEISN